MMIYRHIDGLFCVCCNIILGCIIHSKQVQYNYIKWWMEPSTNVAVAMTTPYFDQKHKHGLVFVNNGVQLTHNCYGRFL